MLWNKECIAHRTNPKLQFVIIHQIGQLVKCYIKKGIRNNINMKTLFK